MERRFYAAHRAAYGNRQRVLSDNITFIPASQLPFKEHWEQIARDLPAGEALLVVPNEETRLTQVARALVPQLRARGRHITAVATQLEH